MELVQHNHIHSIRWPFTHPFVCTTFNWPFIHTTGTCTIYSLSNCPNHVQQTMNSRNEVNEVKFNAYSKLCSAKQRFTQLRMGVKQCILLLLCVKCSTGCKMNKEKNSYYTYVKNKILSVTTAGMTSENCEKGWTWTGLQAQSALGNLKIADSA